MDVLHFCWHFLVIKFCTFLSIIIGTDCDYVQYLSWFNLLFACCVLAVLFIIVLLFSLFYRRSLMVRVKADRHVA
nr:putative 7 protein [Infectious bronchitis virus]